MSYTTTDVIEVLRVARQRIATGWLRGDYQEGDRFCLLGACGVRRGQGDEFPATQAALRLLCEASPPPERPWERTNYQGGLVGFNDDPNTTIDQVMTCIDRAIALEERRTQQQTGVRT